MATKPKTTQPPADDLVGQSAADPVPVRVLQDCAYGRCNAVADVPAVDLASAKAGGLVDDHPDAVAYARSLAAD